MKRIKDVLIGVIIGSMLFTVPIFAQAVNSSINVKLNAINVQLEGEPVEVNSILYQCSTYLPMRKVAELVGKDIEWEPDTMTANIIEGGLDVDNIINGTTYLSVVELVCEIDKTGKYALLNFRDSSGNTYLQLVEYTNREKWEYSVLLNNVPYITEYSKAYISKDYYEQTVLPLIR